MGDGRQEDEAASNPTSSPRESHGPATIQGPPKLKRPTWLRNRFRSGKSRLRRRLFANIDNSVSRVYAEQEVGKGNPIRKRNSGRGKSR